MYPNSNSPMFRPTEVYKPFAYPRAVDFTVKHERVHWTESEIDLSDDVNDWKTGATSQVEKDFIVQILRMFTQSDLNVGGLYADELIPYTKNNEVRNMWSSFWTREGVHQRAYALLNDTLGLPEVEYRAFLEYEEMADKDDFMKAADSSTLEGLSQTLVKGVCNEGISLFASFVMLLSFQRFGKMKGMCKVVEWSIADETMHVEGLCYVFRQLVAEHPFLVTDEFKKYIYNLIRECVTLEDRFIDLAFKTGAIQGMTPEEVKGYIRFIADRRLVMLGLKPNFNIETNPMPWVDKLLSIPDHTNFFENKVTEYEAGNMPGNWGYEEMVTIYSKNGCPYCEDAASELAGREIPFEIVDLSDDDLRADFYSRTNTKSVPQIYYNSGDQNPTHIGGYTDLMDRLKVSNL